MFWLRMPWLGRTFVAAAAAAAAGGGGGGGGAAAAAAGGAVPHSMKTMKWQIFALEKQVPQRKQTN